MRPNVGADSPTSAWCRVLTPSSLAPGVGHCQRQDTGLEGPRSSRGIARFVPCSGLRIEIHFPPTGWDRAGFLRRDKTGVREAKRSGHSICRRLSESPRADPVHTAHTGPKSIASYYYNINIQYSYNNTIDFLGPGCTDVCFKEEGVNRGLIKNL